MFAERSLTLFRIRGVPIRAHWTLLLILPYLALVLSLQFPEVAKLAGVADAKLVLPPFVWGALLAIGLFASVLLHELAHTLVALRFGGRVHSITLMLVGGVSQLSRAPQKPRDEALMAAVGPATSLVLGVLLYLAFASAAGAPVDLQMGLFYLAAMNLTLGLFNLVPAFPLDGGRILRALLAARLGREHGTTIAAGVGRIFGVLIGALGVWSMNFLLMIVAVFIYLGARDEAAAERMRAAMLGRRIADLIPRTLGVPTVGAAESLMHTVRRMQELESLELVVLDEAGSPINVITANDLDTAAPVAWGSPVGMLAARLPIRFVTITLDAPAAEVAEAAAEVGAGYMLVKDSRTRAIVALLAVQDLAKMIALQQIANRIPLSALRVASASR
jgi:Zn-dependent protease